MLNSSEFVQAFDKFRDNNPDWTKMVPYAVARLFWDAGAKFAMRRGGAESQTSPSQNPEVKNTQWYAYWTGVHQAVQHWAEGESMKCPYPTPRGVDPESQVGSQVVGHSPATPYTTLGEVAAELRRMKADGVTRGSLLYALDRVYAS